MKLLIREWVEGSENTRKGGLNWVSNMTIFRDPKTMTKKKYFYLDSPLTRLV